MKTSTLVAFLVSVVPSVAWAQASTGTTTADACHGRAGYWCDWERGWHFYEDPEAEPAKPKTAPKRAVTSTPKRDAKSTKQPELLEFERLQKQLEEYRNVAIMSPTEGNVRRYMELESSVVKRASYFADVAQRVAWTTPELDPTWQGRPVNAIAMETFDRDQLSRRMQLVSRLSTDHVLFFFYRSDCPFCHSFAPALEAFQRRYGLQIVPVSLDGGPLPNFPQFRHDNGIAKTLNVTAVPAVFLAQPFTGRITPLGAGVLSEAQLLERIAAIAAPGFDAMLPSAAKTVSLK